MSEAASVIDEIASALLAAHAKGIIHRDLKPDNVFMVTLPGRWPEVKLLDWGLAKLAPELAGKTRTLAGQVLGTPVYMSPEQARAQDIDHRTDIYALGVTSYELLTGNAPFRKRTSIDTMVSHQEDPVPPLRDQVPTVPEELAQLIEAMLAKEADDRPTLAAVRAVLKRLRGTKIPTMTAAGLQVDLPDPSPAPVHGPPTMQDAPMSQDVTSPRYAGPPFHSPVRAPTPLPLPPPSPSMQMPVTTLPGYSMHNIYEAARGSGPLPTPAGPAGSGSAPAPAPRSSRRWLAIAIALVIAAAGAIAVVVAST
jgi:serine/threonine-protein kinase